MAELEYVKKHKRRKIAAITTCSSLIVIGVFILISFIGKNVGTFTVSLNNGDVKLSLSEKLNYSSSTSYLLIDTLPPFEEYTYSRIISQDLDDENVSYLDGENKDTTDGESTSLKYFKYTFYVKNVSSKTAGYHFNVNIMENTPSRDGIYLDNILRVMLYENDANSDEHNFKVYAKASEEGNEYINENGETQITYREYISTKGKYGFAEPFVSDNVIASITVNNFEENDIKRYTIVTWIEGEDPQSHTDAPENATLKLGVEINAYENN